MNCHIRSLYICVRDMERAVTFYEAFFEARVTRRDDIYSVFDVNGFRFGLFAYEKTGENHTFGNSCLPSVDVPDRAALQEKLRDKKVVFPVTRIGSNWVSEFEDSEGNHIELTAQVGTE